MDLHAKEFIGPGLCILYPYTEKIQYHKDQDMPEQPAIGEEDIQKGCCHKIKSGMQEFVVMPENSRELYHEAHNRSYQANHNQDQFTTIVQFEFHQ
jgi:hypothetical protein